MSQSEVFASTLPHKLMIFGIVFCMLTIPFVWVFTHPWTSESMVFVSLAVMTPIFVFLYSFLIQKIEVRDGQIITRNFLGIANVPSITIASVQEIESYRSARGQTLIFKFIEAEQIEVSVQFLSLNQLADFLLRIKLEKPEVQMPLDFLKILDPSLSPLERDLLVKDLENVDTKKVMKLIAYASLIVLCILLFKLSIGEEINSKELADMFLGFF